MKRWVAVSHGSAGCRSPAGACLLQPWSNVNGAVATGGHWAGGPGCAREAGRGAAQSPPLQEGHVVGGTGLRASLAGARSRGDRPSIASLERSRASSSCLACHRDRPRVDERHLWAIFGNQTPLLSPSCRPPGTDGAGAPLGGGRPFSAGLTP